MYQTNLDIARRSRPKGQLLKWVGNKFRYAKEIVSFLPNNFKMYYEPFVGTGAVLGTLNPRKSVAGDTLEPLIGMWKVLKEDPEELISYYANIIPEFNKNREEVYEEIKQSYNTNPNPFDLLIISRTCYGGVMRFRKDGAISTPIGPHKPIAPKTFRKRAWIWHERIKRTSFFHQSFEKTLENVQKDDLIYCDPPYVDSQSILYGSQDFSFKQLLEVLEICKRRGAKVVLSIDGKKKSGKKIIELEMPVNLFEREVYLECGSSMLKRFQNGGEQMIGEDVHDRLLLTW